MSVLSSHILNAVNGKSASGVRVQLFRLISESEKEIVFDIVSDEQGRLAETVEILDSDSAQPFEMILHAHQYFVESRQISDVTQHMEQVVIRFTMIKREPRYHIPVVLSPHSYTVWWSE